MKRLTARSGWWLAGALALGWIAAAANAAELSIPCGYFNASGGFYGQGGSPCLRFAAAGGCTLPTDYHAVLGQIVADAPDAGSARSWYAGEVPAYCGGAPNFYPTCMPAAGEATHPVREDVGPGLPLEQP